MRSLKNITSSQKLILSVTLALVMLFLSISGASAVLRTINTNDDTDSDWDEVPIFVTDPSGDLGSCSGGSSTDDIIEGYVQTGPEGADPVEWIYFRVRTAASPALDTQYHMVSAYVDCPPYGEDIKDLNVIYYAYEDQVIIADGQLPDPDRYTNFGNPPRPEAERPSDATDTLEWSVDFDFFSQNPSYGGSPNCTPATGKPDNPTGAHIKFSTVQTSSLGSYNCTYDETDYTSLYAGYDFPTVVELTSFTSAQNHKDTFYILVSSISLFLAILVAGFGLFFFRKYHST